MVIGVLQGNAMSMEFLLLSVSAYFLPHEPIRYCARVRVALCRYNAFRMEVLCS
jgi:hypothetical protein